MFLSDQLLVVWAGVLLGCQRAPPELTSGVLANLEAWQLSGKFCSLQIFIWVNPFPSLPSKCISQFYGLTRVNPSILDALKENVNLDTKC